MDTLSLILDDMRLEGSFVYMQLGSPWALAIDARGMAAFHIVTGGEAWLALDGDEPRLLETGDLVVLPGGAPHQIKDRPASMAVARDVLPDLLARPPVRHLVESGGGAETRTVSGLFRFDPDMAAPLMAALPPVLHVRSHDATLAPWLAVGLEFLGIEMASQRPAHQAIVNRMLDVMLMQSVRHYVESLPENSDNWLAALRDKALSAALGQMHARPAHDWTVQELAGVACLSRSAFAERFSQVLGTPPLGYLTRHRMRLAARHLANSGHPVSRVAEMVGYGSEAAFSQAFKREYGVPPSSWREQRQHPSSAEPAAPPPAP